MDIKKYEGSKKEYFSVPVECGAIASMEKEGGFLHVITSKNRLIKVRSAGIGYECLNEKVIKLIIN